jgi:hypothetical protein
MFVADQGSGRQLDRNGRTGRTGRAGRGGRRRRCGCRRGSREFFLYGLVHPELPRLEPVRAGRHRDQAHHQDTDEPGPGEQVPCPGHHVLLGSLPVPAPFNGTNRPAASGRVVTDPLRRLTGWFSGARSQGDRQVHSGDAAVGYGRGLPTRRKIVPGVGSSVPVRIPLCPAGGPGGRRRRAAVCRAAVFMS